jgi:hypothetical protein
MFARSVSFRLKPNSIAAFTKLIEDETLPLLRKQKGFQDEITPELCTRQALRTPAYARLMSSVVE